MRWIVGLDLRPGSEGPSRFARWLADASGAREPQTALFVHVLEEEHLRFALRLHHLDEVTAAARGAADALLARTGASGEVRVVQGLTAEEGLEEARASAGADGVIVGRAADRAGPHLVHLGRVARRLLRRLSSPVAVVPPDLKGEELGDGPVVALASLGDDALGGCRLAARLATALGRRLAVLHVARGQEPSYLPSASWGAALEAHRAEAGRALEAWLSAHGIRADVAAAALGSPVQRALELAGRERAPLLVAGSRHLSAAERIVHASTGSALAQASRIPVIVAPAGT